MSIYSALIDLFRAVSVNDGGTDALRVTGTGTGGSSNVLVQNSLVKVAYDYIDATYPSATQEVYIFKTGGSGGTTVATMTVNYTTSIKDVLDDVTVT